MEKKLKIISMKDEQNDFSYWITKSYQERIDAIEAYRKKIMKIIDEVEINFIGLNELIKNKQASGRDKDLLDLKNLKK
ncbi:MAG: hypothetical protein L3J41_13060 [Melioribacteraceae bacterium]|nr:hypothetical protein [Melioribacteraceae bacterium]